MLRHRVTGLTVAAIAAGLSVTAAGSPAAADTPTELYVNHASGANCSDAGAGTQSQPYCTIAAAIAAVSAGQTITINGIYDERVTIDKSGTPGNPITLRAQPPGALRAVALGIDIDDQHDISIVGLVMRPGVGVTGFEARNATRLTVRGVQVIGVPQASPTGAPGVRLAAVTDSSFTGLFVNANTDTGITLDAATTNVVLKTPRITPISGFSSPAITVFGSNNTIVNGLFNSNGDGIVLKPGAANNIVANNDISMGRGVAINNIGATGTAIANNNVVGNCGTGIRVAGASSGVSVQNNIAHNNGAGYSHCDLGKPDRFGVAVYDGAVADTIVDYNSVYQPEGAPSPYVWGGVAYPSVAAFRTASGQGAHDQLAALSSPLNRDSANSAAPGWQATDKLGRFPENDPDTADTGDGPITYADRGTTELVMGPKVQLTTPLRDNGISITADASATTAGWVPLVPEYRFNFGDGTIITQSTPVATHTYAQRGSYDVSVTVKDTNGVSGSVTHHISGGTYVPVGPERVLDTRSKVGVPTSTPVAAGGTVTLPVTGANGVPATGVTAVAFNVTVTAPTKAGFLTVYPDGKERPTASNLNWTARQTIPNMVVVPVVNGKVTFYNGSAGTVHILADLLGYYSSGLGSLYSPAGPERVLDTRSQVGVPTSTPVPAGGTVTLPLTGANGVPATGVTAVALNVTATGPTKAGFLTVYPDGNQRPTASNLNWTAGQTIPNMVVVPVVNGKVTFYNGSAGTVYILADLLGYYSSGPGRLLTDLGPRRVVDTRNRIGTGTTTPVAAHDTLVLTVSGPNGVLAPDVTALVLSVTVTEPTAGGFLTVYPDGTQRPNASNLNWVAGQTIPNLVVVPVVNGKVTFYNGSAGTVHILADLLGYFAS